MYLENPDNQVFTLHSHKLNNYFRDEKNKNLIKFLNQEAKLRITDENFNSGEMFCAKYSIDSNWYRVKYIRQNKTTDDVNKFISINGFYIIILDFGIVH